MLLSQKSPDANSVTAIYTSGYDKLDEKRAMVTTLEHELHRVLRVDADTTTVRAAA